MQLVEVELENYKQYAGKHLFKPGEKAMVAIVGQNGAGKTTLFEAIEWCLYNPSRIRNDSLTPRLQGGKPRVRVVLEDAQTGIVYEIERSLKSGSTQAEIYRQDQPESPLVQGTRQVTEYVTRELTGLPHTAFVSTFFTRQKELSFFGELGATDRREQVGRLLGLETIRVAQRSISEKRNARQAEARVKREQYEAQSKGIDFPAERERLDIAIGEQASLRDRARTEETTRKAETAASTTAQEVAQQRFGAHAELLQALERASGEARRYEEIRNAANRDLAAIAEAETEIERQRGQALVEPDLRTALERHDAERKKLEDSQKLTADLQQLHSERSSIVAVLPAGSHAGSTATIAETTNLIALFDTEIARLATIDLEGLRRRRDLATSLAALDEDLSKARAKLETMQKLADELSRQVEELAQGGTPAERLRAVQSERATLQQSMSAALSVAAQTELRAKQLRALEESLRASEFGELCPTCARPFAPGEAAKTVDALTEQVQLLDEHVAAERGAAELLAEQVRETAVAEAALESVAEEYQRLTGRLETGSVMIETQKREVAEIGSKLETSLREADRHEVPDTAEIERCEGDVRAAESECSRLPRLEVGREQLAISIQRQQTIEGEISALGAIVYDIEAHRRDHAAWETARDAAARIQELQKRVAERADREATVTTSTEKLAALATERARIDTDIADLSYQPAELDDANHVLAESLDRERAATEAAHLAERQLREAQRAREDLDKLETRLKSLAEESALAEVAAAELSRAYTEFARFEKYVALVVTPVLGETASELLEKVTDGKYDRLEFTEDYGIEVYDGEDDRFPLNQYSGGERDVIALCARLALSQVIGGQAATPIQFMVLDEVFGSLDIDRRRNLMEMLQRLMEENKAFQQLFVISHVDDVRAGAMFDEVWRVSETTEGVSQLEQVSVTGALEDY